MKIIRNCLICLVIILYALMNLFIVNHINVDLISSFGINIKYILLIIFSIGTIVALVTYGAMNKNIGATAGKIGIYSFGFSIMAFFIILITNIISKIIFWKSGYYKWFGAIQILIIFVVFVYGRYNTSKTKITEYNLKIEKESNLEKLKIILISDLHLGYFNDNKKLKKNVDIINNLNPDIVAIAGDLFDQNFEAVQKTIKTKEILNSIKSKYGTYLSFGNHDSGETFKGMKSFIQSTNIKLLEDRAVAFDKEFIIAGRRDMSPVGYSGGVRSGDWNKDSIKDLPIIVLEHQPIFKEYEDNADLILSGHTHKGQIFPFNLITKMHFENHYGYVKLKSGIHTIVTSGLGTWGPPIRLGSRNEIVQINVEFRKNK